MYYNGYIIICIFIGAYLGAFVFQWETIGLEVSTCISFLFGGFFLSDDKIADLSPRLQLLRNRLCAAARLGVMKSKGVWRKGADLLEF